ncbi:hypothetical protein V7S43_004350 [Phytophthora oleae]|uniref:Intimal thickness related receptor IRP domain-containing protein n=1 Tax=Phytophthora oleae TaxID=2107226 RepID=A0ABD3FZT8_9STRA
MLNLNVIAPAEPSDASAIKNGRWSPTQRLLLVAWLVLGLLPWTLQLRSYAKFIRPHKVPENIVVPSNSLKLTEKLTEICPVEAYILAGVWWNLEATHYYTTDHDVVCHAVMPQYNLHGNYLIGSFKTTPFRTSSPSCKNASFPINMYLYHGSIGLYSSTTPWKARSAPRIEVRIMGMEFGTYDINGVLLTRDTGSRELRLSYWYCGIGSLWLVYRSLILRQNYGRKCKEMGEKLHQGGAVVFVQESLRLSAHGATNYQRCALLYLVMTDLFLLIANEGWATRVRYASLGYNLSGLILLLFEMLESTRWLSEKWRLRIKILFFSYEAVLLGELVSALAFQKFLTGLNRSDLKTSKVIALAASYYVWSLVGHGVIALVSIAIILSVRILCALTYVWLVHRSFAVLSEPCCIDTVLGVRSELCC